MPMAWARWVFPSPVLPYTKRIVCGVAGILGDCHAGGAAEAVAVSLYEAVKGVGRVEIGIDGDAFQAGNHVRVLDLLYLVLGQGYVGIDDFGRRFSCRVSYCGVLHDGYLVHQSCLGAYDPFQGLAEYVDEVGFYEFGEVA